MDEDRQPKNQVEDQSEGQSEDHQLSDEPLSEEAVQPLKAKLPSALTEGSVEMDDNQPEDQGKDHQLSDELLSEEAVQPLKARSPSALTEGSVKMDEEDHPGDQGEGQSEDHQLSDEPLSEEVVQLLKAKLPSALTEGSVEDVKALIQSRAALSVRLDYNCPAFDDYSVTNIPLLHIASAYGPPEIVRFLLDLGVNIAETTEADSTVLHLAARRGRNENLTMLIERGAKPLINVPMLGQKFPLDEAAWTGQIETCKTLIAQGANVGAKDYLGRTALIHAAIGDHSGVIETLLDGGADVNDVSNKKWTALHHAAAQNRPKVIKLLLSRGADSTLQEGEIGNPLHLAAMKGSRDAAVALLSQAPDNYTEAKNGYGNAALHLAALDGQPHLVQTLIGYSADMNVINTKLWTPLHIACEEGNLDVAKILVHNGARTDERNRVGDTPLQLASNRGEAEIVSLLLNHKADVDTNNDFGNTSLQLAAGRGHHKVVKILLDHNAAVGTRNKELSTPLHLASICGDVQVISELLAHKGNLTQMDECGYTALHIASDFGRVDGAALLIDEDANPNARSDQGETPLHLAAHSGHLETVKLLLNRGAEVDPVDSKGDTPLHRACYQEQTPVMELLITEGADIHLPNNLGRSPFDFACSESYLELFTPLIQVRKGLLRTNPDGWSALHHAAFHGANSFAKELLEDGDINPSLRTREGQSPLRLAIEKRHVGVALELLNSLPYYPKSPVDSHTYPIVESETPIITEGLQDLLAAQEPASEYGLDGILYWAIANGQSCLIEDFLKTHQGKASQLKRGMTCLHVAAQYGQEELVKKDFHDLDPFTKTDDGFTSFHVAAASDHLAILVCLLNRLSQQPESQIDAIIMLSDEQESCISLAAKKRNTKIKWFLWSKLESLAIKEPEFYSKNQNRADQILELAAQFERPGKEIYLQMMLENWFGKPSPKPNGHTVLHLAIYHRQVVVLWWLLSNGAHFKTEEIQLAHDMLAGNSDSVSMLMMELLHNPPQIVEHAAITESDRPPVRPKKPDSASLWKDLPVTMIDLYDNKTTADLHYITRSVQELIYQTSGPNEIMRSSRNQGHRKLRYLKQDLARIIYRQTHTTPEANPYHRAYEHGEPSPNFGDLKFRWLHVPANQLQLMNDLATVVSIEEGKTDKQHRSIASFFNRNFTWVTAGQGRTYMKPQCMQEFTSSPEEHDIKEGPTKPPKIDKLALYIPFLSLGKIASPPKDDEKGRAEQVSSRKSSLPEEPVPPSQEDFDEPMTLDQYFYPTEDTSKRDHDQVVSKYLDRVASQTNGSSTGNQNNNRPDDPSAEPSQKTILMVDQLWMWILDGRTIITTSTKSSDQHDDILSAGIREFVMSNQSKSSLERVSSVESMIEIILGVASGLFLARNIPTERITNANEREKKSALEIFREHIRTIADTETQLFDEFLKELNKEKTKPEDRDHILALDMAENPYHIISKEAELLNEIKDIHDELNMLRTLAESQQHVWEQLFQTKKLEHFAHFQFIETCTPNMVLREIQNMMTEAEMVQNSINTLLDLRTNQAGLKEAEFGRQQAYDTARQANVIFVFTIVTIVFLPLSFLSSLFALNVTEFPHISGNVEYEAWWIFPILFGVSAGVSVPFILLAFNFEKLVKKWRPPKHDTRKKNADTNDMSAPQSESMGSQKSDIENLASLDKSSGLPKSLLSRMNDAVRQRRGPQNMR